MTDSDKENFREIMSTLCELYSKKISKTMLRMYFECLKEFTIEQVASSIMEHLNSVKHGSYFPKPSDIRRGIVGEAVSPSEEFRQYLRSQGREVRF